MASFDNFANEKSGVFEDADCDPDLEARLYAEIYYSNETYEQDSSATLDSFPNVDPRPPREFVPAVALSDECLANKENLGQDSDPGVADSSRIANFADPKTFYPSRSWVCKERANKVVDNPFARQNSERRNVRPQRALAREGLWLPRISPVAQTPHAEPSRLEGEDTAQERRSAESPEDSPLASRSGAAANVFAQFCDGLTTFSEIARTSDDAERRARENAAAAKKKERTKKRRKEQILKRQQFRAAKKLRRRLNGRDYEDLATVTSKYKVVSKSNKLNVRQMELEPVYISSDSDDSILEVPVPPKAPPPVIQLQDSDDESGKSTKNRSSPAKKTRKPSIDIHEECSISGIPETSTSTTNNPVAEENSTAGSTNFQKNSSKESANKTRNADVSPRTPTNSRRDNDDEPPKSAKSRSKKCRRRTEDIRDDSAYRDDVDAERSKNDDRALATIVDSVSGDSPKNSLENTRRSKNSAIPVGTADPIENDLIINCTGIQRGVSCLEDIRKMREGETLSRAYSEDSMTESETNNWVNIAAGQANTSGNDAEACFTDPSVDHFDKAIWDQLTQETPTASVVSDEIPTTSGVATSPIPTSATRPKKNPEISVTNTEETNTRKRGKESESVTFDDFYVPAVPEKRIKRGKQKSSVKQSMTEYFFKPMSKEMQAFYNNPRGGENLDLYDIQSRMPKNPRCWAILDADLRGPAPRRRNTCPRCRTDSHFGKRCPEKQKAPCCYMCGTKGHTESRCPHTMCLTCGRQYATYRPTCGFCSQLRCSMCNGMGHGCQNCPDLWRRYHSTTTETAPIPPRDVANVMKPTQNLSCCNCGKRGHDVTTCRQLRWSQHFPTPINVTSYTEGPMYELPVRNFIPEVTLIDDDATFESSFDPRNRRNDAPSRSHPETLHDDDVRSTNLADETVTIAIEDSPTYSDPSTAISEGRLIFRAGETDQRKTIRWHKLTIRLDTLENVNLSGVLRDRAKPTFLDKWQNHLDFGVEIIHKVADGSVCATIKCRNSDDSEQLAKVVVQWLVRSDDERPYLVYEKLSCVKKQPLNREIEDKVNVLLQIRPGAGNIVRILRKIELCDRVIKRLRQSLTNRMNPVKREHTRTKLRAKIVMARRTRTRLPASLYGSDKINGGERMFRRFYELAEKTRSTDGKLSPKDYFEIVYLYNELFTFYKTRELTEALKKVADEWRNDPGPKFFKFDCFDYPNADPAKCIAVDGETDIPDIHEKRLPGNNSFVAVADDRRPEAVGNSLADSLRVLRDLGASCVIGDLSRPSVGAPTTANAEKSQIIRATHKMNRHERGLLKNMTKKQRRNHERSAHAAINAAFSSNVPSLRDMAANIKRKMADETVHASEIAKLRSAMQQNARPKKSKAQQQGARKKGMKGRWASDVGNPQSGTC